MEGQINCIGIQVGSERGNASTCLSALAGNTPIYFHGSLSDIELFAKEILEKIELKKQQTQSEIDRIAEQ